MARHARLHAPALAQTLGEDLAHLQERGRQPDYARLNEGVKIYIFFSVNAVGGWVCHLVELAGDGGGQRQQSAQLEELPVLLLPPVPVDQSQLSEVLVSTNHSSPCRVLALVLHDGEAVRGDAAVVGVVVGVGARGHGHRRGRAGGHNTDHAATWTIIDTYLLLSKLQLSECQYLRKNINLLWLWLLVLFQKNGKF